MFFFRTISLVAALAFATLSSAVPVEGAGLVASGDVFARDVSELALPLKRGQAVSDLYNTCHGNVVEIIANIQIAIDAGNHDDVLDHLNEIVVQINVLITGVRGYTTVDVDLDITVEVFAGIVCGLIQIIVTVLSLCVSINVQITSCIGVIGGLLGTLVQVTLGVVVGLDVILTGLLQPLAGSLNHLGFLDIFINVGIFISL